MALAYGPPVPYDNTAQRLTINDLPHTVRIGIFSHFTAPPVHIANATAGFSGGFAATITSENGTAMFVKAAGPDMPVAAKACAAEAHVNPHLPPSVPAPRLQFAVHIDEWVVLGFDVVNGRAPRLPITSDQWTLMLDAWAVAAQALTPAPNSLQNLGLPTLREQTDGIFTQFTAMAGGSQTTQPVPVHFRQYLDTLAELETHIYDALDADAICHGDLRPDNMILTDEQAWICDWTYPSIAAPWFDTIPLLAVAQGDGFDANTMFMKHSTSRNVEPEQLDSVLAAVAGYYLGNSTKPLIPGVSTHIRDHQRWNGLATLDWLANRRGW